MAQRALGAHTDEAPNSAATAVIQELQSNNVSVIYLPQQAAVTPMLTLPGWLGGDKFQFTINSPPGQVLQVQVSTNLASTNWTLLGQVTNTTGTLSFTNTSATARQQFYRLFMP